MFRRYTGVYAIRDSKGKFRMVDYDNGEGDLVPMLFGLKSAAEQWLCPGDEVVRVKLTEIEPDQRKRKK